MFKKSLLILLTLCAAASAQQVQPLIVSRKVPDGITVVPWVATAPPYYWPAPNGRVVIPEYANGATFPAGGVIGWGPGSVIQATSQTDALADGQNAVIMTDGYNDSTTAMWESYNTATQTPGPIQPFIKDVTIVGIDSMGDDWYNSTNAWNYITTGADKYHGVLWGAAGGQFRNVTLFGFPGHGAYLGRWDTQLWGGIRPFDDEKLVVDHVLITMCKRGLEVGVIDASVGNVFGSWNKEYTIKFSGGATQIAGPIHTWGGDLGVWFSSSAGACWGGPFYVEQGPNPMWIQSSGNVLGPIHTHTATAVAITVDGQNNILGPIHADIKAAATPPIVIQVNNQFNTILDATILGIRGGDTAVMYNNAYLQVFKGRIDLWGGASVSTGIKTEASFSVRGCFFDVEVIGSTNCTVLDTPLWGFYNYVNLRSGASGLGQLPDKMWSKLSGAGAWTTTPKNTLSWVIVNGVRYYPPTDEFAFAERNDPTALGLLEGRGGQNPSLEDLRSKTPEEAKAQETRINGPRSEAFGHDGTWQPNYRHGIPTSPLAPPAEWPGPTYEGVKGNSHLLERPLPGQGGENVPNERVILPEVRNSREMPDFQQELAKRIDAARAAAEAERERIRGGPREGDRGERQLPLPPNVGGGEQGVPPGRPLNDPGRWNLRRRYDPRGPGYVEMPETQGGEGPRPSPGMPRAEQQPAEQGEK